MYRRAVGGPRKIFSPSNAPKTHCAVGAAVLEADKDAAEADPPAVGQQEVLPPGLIGECVTRHSQADRVLRVCAFVFRFIDAIRAGRSKGQNPTKDTVRLRQAPLPPLLSQSWQRPKRSSSRTSKSGISATTSRASHRGLSSWSLIMVGN